MMNKSSETIILDLIHQAQQGDEASQTRLADGVRPKVYTYLLRLTLDHHLAEDLCQDTLLQMTRSLPKLKIDTIAGLWGWLYRTALNSVRQYLRTQQRRAHRQESAWSAEDLLDDRSYGLEGAIKTELLETVMAAMDELKVSYRNILVLRCFDQLSYAEIAEISGSTQLRAKQLFFCAKQSLKRQLKRRGYGSSYTRSALGLFAMVTLSVQNKAEAMAMVSEASLQASPLAAVLQVLFAKTVAVVVGLGLLTGLAATTVVHKHHQQDFQWPQNRLTHLIDDPAFVYPNAIVSASSDWYDSLQAYGPPRRQSIEPNTLLVGPRPASQHSVLLARSSFIELSFAKPLQDGPGPDLIIVGWGCRTMQVTLTDGRDKRFSLPAPHCTVHPEGFSVIAYDLGEFPQIPFAPSAVYLKGEHALEIDALFRLNQVRARVHINTQ
ncbi:RNA polymerase sigma factor [Planctomycetota bacterium]